MSGGIDWDTGRRLCCGVDAFSSDPYHAAGCPNGDQEDSMTLVHTPKVIDAKTLDYQRIWSLQTFGPGARTAGVIDHIRKELAEVEADPDDESEWADIIILAIDGAARRGMSGQRIIDAVLAKYKTNHDREWPDWRTADPDKAIEHIR